MELNPLNKKNGFTLIELIIAIAIVAFVFPAISSVFINAMNNTRDESIKLDTMTGVQSIVQTLKLQGKYGVNAIYIGFNPTGNLSITKTFTYNNIDEVSGISGKFNLPEPTDDDFNTKKAALITFCTNPPSGTHYKGEITIVPESDPNTSNVLQYFRMYKVTVKVSDLYSKIETNDSIIYTNTSEETAYIGG